MAPASETSRRRTATPLHLWATGVGAVISGDFFGWQATLSGGFGSGLVTLLAATFLYLLLTCSVAEVASLLQKGAGPCFFAQECFGRRAAFFTGLAETLKCISVICVIATAIGSYLGEITQTSKEFAPCWWLIFITAVSMLNMVGAELGSNFQLVVTTTSVVLLCVFYVGALLSGINFYDHALGDGKTIADTTSASGVMQTWAFGMWFYLGIEELPLAMEMTVDPERNMPRGLMLSFVTLMLIAFSTFTISSSIPLGAAGMAHTDYPLLEGYLYVFGDTKATQYGCLVLVIGLIASLHSFIFATGELVVSMAVARCYPLFLARRSESSGSPYMAVMVSSALAYAALFLLYQLTAKDIDRLGFVAMAMCLFCTLLSYAMQLLCFLWLRSKRPDEERIFVSPFGIPGAILCLALCTGSLGAIFYLAVMQNIYWYGILLAAASLGSCFLCYELLWTPELQPLQSALLAPQVA